jgi:hypothetical protein
MTILSALRKKSSVAELGNGLGSVLNNQCNIKVVTGCVRVGEQGWNMFSLEKELINHTEKEWKYFRQRVSGHIH